jgi:murein DD-endopeptidase MepM/ murein hydrolase activator NlpD
VIALLSLAIVAGAALWVRCERAEPVVEAPADLAVGRGGRTVPLAVADPDSGLRALAVRLRHAGGEAGLLERDFAGSLLTGGLEHAVRGVEVTLDPGALGLREGDAFLVVEVRDWSWAGWLRGNRTVHEVPVVVDLKPPRVEVLNGLTYLQRGGAGVAAYRLAEPVARDGVEVGDVFFPGHPLPGAADPALRAAFFAIPRDVPREPPISVVAEDRAGNAAARGWQTRLQERGFPDVPIQLTPSFMATKVPELAQALGVAEGSALADFQKINREQRAADEARIREIVATTGPERLWSGAFLQLRNSAVTSRFAEHRTYFLSTGEKVSEAIHYGYDLASLAGAPIEAANAGRVVFADDLGIYGSCVVVDHGLGVASLYAHLSRVDVAPGDEVEQGATLGLSGATGLAGGDHLHFAMLVGGVYVDPVEWWDAKWIREKVDEPLAAAATR